MAASKAAVVTVPVLVLETRDLEDEDADADAKLEIRGGFMAPSFCTHESEEQRACRRSMAKRPCFQGENAGRRHRSGTR
jgi:hypothetical protein